MKKVTAVLALLLATLATSSASAQRSWDEIPRDKKGRPWPKTLPYRGTVPNGYHVDTHTRDGLIVGGSIMFGVSYLLCVYAAGSSKLQRAEWLYVPVAGPLVFAGTHEGDRTGINALAAVLAGLLQVGGATMFATGFIPKTELVRNDLAVRVLPVVAPNASGLAFVGTF